MCQDLLNLLTLVPASISFIERARFLVSISSRWHWWQWSFTDFTTNWSPYHGFKWNWKTIFVRLTVFSLLAIIFSHFCWAMTPLFNYPLPKSFYASTIYASPFPITLSHFSVFSEQTCPNLVSKSRITFRTGGKNIGQGEGFPLPALRFLSAQLSKSWNLEVISLGKTVYGVIYVVISVWLLL